MGTMRGLARGLSLAPFFLLGGLAGACGDEDPSDASNMAERQDGIEEAPVTPSDDPLKATVRDGQLAGEDLGDAVRFLKIPYAKPPVGALRFAAPQAPEPWQDERAQTEFASPCPQGASQQSVESDNEDCLYLNVWRPKRKIEDAPVMLWIHGGGFRTGSAADLVPTSADALWYDGKVFAGEHGIVVVTFNYRLSSLGFFPLPALAEEGSPVGNQGMLDQQAVLRWVRDNIAAFGGDPNNVTLFGESAGSGSVCMHMAAPGSRGLFHRAIGQSGGCTMGRLGMVGDDTRDNVEALVEEVGCDDGEPEDVLACLREKDVGELVSLEMTSRTSGQTLSLRNFGVVVDGDDGFLPESARSYFDSGDIADVPYLIGSNSEEGQLYWAGATVPEDEAGYMAELHERFGDDADEIAAMYPSSRFDGDYRAALARIQGDSGLVCGTHDTARRAAEHGRSVFMYNFNIDWSIARVLLGPTHASEISHVFGTPYNETEDNIAVAEAMNAYWANFARSGDPNGDDLPARWPPFAPDDNDDDLRLQLDPDFEVLESFRKQECAMWRRLSED